MDRRSRSRELIANCVIFSSATLSDFVWALSGQKLTLVYCSCDKGSNINKKDHDFDACVILSLCAREVCCDIEILKASQYSVHPKCVKCSEDFIKADVLYNERCM